MRIEENVELKNYTTFKLGGVALQFFSPETEEELISLIEKIHPQYYIGGGSNLMINERQFDVVVNLRDFNKEIINLGNGKYRVGASVRLQKLITTINSDGYGGIEYLYSVPGLLGGAVVMNAGRGKIHNQCISDYIKTVKVYKDGEIVWFNKEDCAFSYRNSVFKNSDIIVMEVELQFPKVEKAESDLLRKNRIELCKKHQDNSTPNYGTVFCESDAKIMALMKKTCLGKAGKIRYSQKTLNWMLNYGGSFDDALKLIKRVERLHSFLGKKCKAEVIIWE